LLHQLICVDISWELPSHFCCWRRVSTCSEENVSKATVTALFAALVAATAPGAFAQTSTVPATHTTATSHIIQADEFRASKMMGSAVYDQQNQDIGKVSDIILNKDGKIDAVVVDVGSFLGVGGKYVAVPITDIKADHNRLTLDRTKEQLKETVAYQLENPDTGAGTSPSPATGGHLGR
jgi:sporulation protein YlmC with PRC-barrel domain